jgi:hypothetical protein
VFGIASGVESSPTAHGVKARSHRTTRRTCFRAATSPHGDRRGRAATRGADTDKRTAAQTASYSLVAVFHLYAGPSTVIRTPTATRHQRVEQARNARILPKHPIPVLLLITRAYVDEWHGLGPHGSLAFGQGVDRVKAMNALRVRLDRVEPEAFAGVVASWAADHRAKWLP